MQFLTVLQWGAAISGTLAAIMVASRLTDRITGYGFAVFTLSSILWITSGLMDETYSLAMQNGALFVVNLFGVWRWLLSDRRKPARQASGGRPPAPGGGQDAAAPRIKPPGRKALGGSPRWND